MNIDNKDITIQKLKSYPFWKVVLIIYGIFGVLAVLCLSFVPESFMPIGLLRFMISLWITGLLPLFLWFIYIYDHNIIYVSENETAVETDCFYITDTRHRSGKACFVLSRGK